MFHVHDLGFNYQGRTAAAMNVADSYSSRRKNAHKKIVIALQCAHHLLDKLIKLFMADERINGLGTVQLFFSRNNKSTN